MRKKIVVCLFIIFFIILFNNKIYANKIYADEPDNSTTSKNDNQADNTGNQGIEEEENWLIDYITLDTHDVNIKEITMNGSINTVDDSTYPAYIEYLQNVYGCQETDVILPPTPSSIDPTMTFKTKIYILEPGDKQKKYKIQIGGAKADNSGNTGTVLEVEEDILINQYKYVKGKDEWNVVLLGFPWKLTYWSDYSIKINQLYLDDGSDKSYEDKLNRGDAVKTQDVTTVSETINDVKDTLDDVTDIIGNLHMKLYEIKLMPFDAIQSVIDMLQTVNYGGNKRFLPWKITYPEEELVFNKIVIDNDKNQYVNYTTGSDNLGTNGQRVVFIDENKSGLKTNMVSEWIFGAKPQIPVIPIDMYALAKGKVEIFDINFLTGQNNKDLHPDNSVWLIIRNFISAVIHVILYLGASILIIMLVLHGISLVKETIIAERSSPEERKKHIGGIHEMTIAFIKLLGCVLIMGICIFVSDAVFEDMKVTDKMELPIRVNVGSGAKDGSGNQYSFSTNIIGYVRFMANICDPDYVGFKALYTWGYIILVIINVALILVMFIRLLAIILLSLAGPIIAVAGVFNRKELFGLTYQEWAKHYAIWASIQLVFAIIYRILINVCFPN